MESKPERQPGEVPATAVGRLRLALGLSTRDFARVLGVSPSLVHQWDQGTTPLSARMALRIADTFPESLNRHVGSVEVLLRGSR